MKQALSLCGGGSRGSYELGAWTALTEHGFSFDLVTGSSIGALNGTLMVQGDYSLACQLWREITVEDVMANGINLDTSIERMFNQKGDLNLFLRKYAENRGADISPLKDLLTRVIDEPRFRASPMGFGLVTVAFPSLQPLELTKADIPDGMLIDWLLASASCFPAFPMHKIDGKSYLDGGYHDNLPIRFAFKLGADHVTAVDLTYPPLHPEFRRHPCVTYICPSWNLGSILLFDPDVMEQNRRLGYNDACRALGSLFGWRYSFRGRALAPKFQDTAKRFSGFLSRVEAVLSDSGRRGFRRTSAPLRGFLEEHTVSGSLDCAGDLVRSVEAAAERLSVDHLEIWEFQNLVLRLVQRLSGELPPLDLHPALLRAAAGREPEELSLAAQFQAIRGALADARKSGREEDFLAQAAELAASRPRDLVCVLGLAFLAVEHSELL